MEDKETKEVKTSFIKSQPTAREVAEDRKSRPVYDKQRKIYFVNGRKYRRAEEIVELLRGTQIPNKSEELQRIEHYKLQLQKHDVDIEGEDVVPAVYELLGGLIRTADEQERAERVREEAQAKARKQTIETVV